MDPLSDILSTLKLRGQAFRGLDTAGDWAIAYPAGDGIKCFAVDKGTCRLELEGLSEPLTLAAGDLALLPANRRFLLYTKRDASLTDAYSFFSSFRPGEIATINGGGDCCGIGCYFNFGGGHADLLLGALPPVIHVSSGTTRTALRWAIERMMHEMRDPQPGSDLLAEHLAQTLLIEALRALLTKPPHGGTGWLFALADAQLASVFTAMHADPGRRWTLASLASVAGMSRSSFAARFRVIAGEPAMNYLTRWRMIVAADRLSKGGLTISDVAPALGYESESAFGAAFKRVMGCAPRRFASASRQ